MPSQPYEDDPWVGRELAEQVEVLELIGVGAMGRVYRGHQRGIERPVAVKVLHEDLLHRPGVMERFHREARVASRLNHPNVVQVLMTGEVAWRRPAEGGPSTKQGVGRGAASDGDSDKDSPSLQRAAYLVMEYLDGDSLASVLDRHGGPLRLERALHIALQVCDAVGEAHDQGIVHRDLKPENVMLVRRGGDPDFVKVLDFGVAKVDWLDGAQATQVGSVFGTARYMAPEAARGELVTPRSDVYSIATLLYQCLAGRTPFDGTNTVAVLVKQCSESPIELGTIAPHVPEAIARVVHRNLSKTPGERCPTARELGAELLAAAREARIEGFATVARPTLHGSDRPAPRTDPFPERGASASPAVQAPSDTTLIDPELAGTPAGGPLRGRSQLTHFPENQRRGTQLREQSSLPAPAALPGSALSGAALPVPAAEAPAPRGLPDVRDPSRLTLLPEDEPRRPRTLLTQEPHAADAPQGAGTRVEESRAPTTHYGAPEGQPWVGHASMPPAPAPGPFVPPAHRMSSPSGYAPRPDALGRASLWGADALPLTEPPARRRRWPTAARWVAGLTTVLLLTAGGSYLAAQHWPSSEESLTSFLDRANAALALGAWHGDGAGPEGFVEITDAALARYPNAPELLTLRERGAKRMAREARRLQALDGERATELARLAVTLAPEDPDVRALTGPVLAPPVADAAVAVAPEVSATEPAEAAPHESVLAEATASLDAAPGSESANAAPNAEPAPSPSAQAVPASATAPSNGSPTPTSATPAASSGSPAPSATPAAGRRNPPAASASPASGGSVGRPPAPPTRPASGASARPAASKTPSQPASPAPSPAEERAPAEAPETPRERWL